MSKLLDSNSNTSDSSRTARWEKLFKIFGISVVLLFVGSLLFTLLLSSGGQDDGGHGGGGHGPVGGEMDHDSDRHGSGGDEQPHGSGDHGTRSGERDHDGEGH